MKNKKNWNIYLKPYGPVKPIEPEKKINQYDELEIAEDYDTFINLSTIELPSGVDWHDVEIRFSPSDHAVHWKAVSNKQIEIDNPRYESQLEEYKKRLEDWKLKKIEHDKELQEWEIWCNLQKEKQLQRDLKRAEALLKKHGMCVKPKRNADLKTHKV
jgi:hypothetical protein